jgi:hypothetical protein
MDLMKEAVAGAVRDAVLHARIAEALGIPQADIEIQHTDALNTRIRVRQEERGPRYFNIRVSEQL